MPRILIVPGQLDAVASLYNTVAGDLRRVARTVVGELASVRLNPADPGLDPAGITRRTELVADRLRSLAVDYEADADLMRRTARSGEEADASPLGTLLAFGRLSAELFSGGPLSGRKPADRLRTDLERLVSPPFTIGDLDAAASGSTVPEARAVASTAVGFTVATSPLGVLGLPVGGVGAATGDRDGTVLAVTSPSGWHNNRIGGGERLTTVTAGLSALRVSVGPARSSGPFAPPPPLLPARFFA